MLRAVAAGEAHAGRAAIGEAAAGVRDPLATMERNRVRRLRAAGFAEATARRLADLHMPNLM